MDAFYVRINTMDVKMNKYAVLIEVDYDVMYVSDENPFGYNSIPKVFSTLKRKQ
jgi:hypothetical protein